MAIFAYQAYWLVSMYHTMKSDMEHSIIEAMRTSDYNEMMLRIERMRRDDQDHGEISVSAGYNDEGKGIGGGLSGNDSGIKRKNGTGAVHRYRQ